MKSPNFVSSIIIRQYHHNLSHNIRSSINHHTPIRMQALPSNHATILTSQKNKARRDLARLRRPPHRRPAELVLRILLHRGGNERRPNGPRADGVDADAEGDLLVVESAGEGDDGAFAGGVVEQVGAADVGVYGGAVDDCVPGFHVGEGVFGEVEVGVDVCIEGFEPLFPKSCRQYIGMRVDGLLGGLS